MISKFSCKNFRNVNVDDLALSRINIFIGPNNSGKTNLIKAIAFYSNMLKYAADGNEGSDFMNAMSRNGWQHSKNCYAEQSDSVSFEWHLDYNSQPVVYKFAYSVGEKREDYHINLEELSAEPDTQKRYAEKFNYFTAHGKKIGQGTFSTATKKGMENKRIPVKLNGAETVISQFDRLLLDEQALYNAKTFRNDINSLIKGIETAFKSFYSYSSAEFDVKEIRRRVDSKGFDRFLRRDGRNFANLFYKCKNESLLWKKKYVDMMRLFYRSIVDIDVIDQRDSISLAILEEDKETDLADVSEGTLKALLWGILFCPTKDYQYELLALDEPETNLHPAWQRVMGDVIMESKSYRQCIISTHSPDFLDSFTELFKKGEDVSVYAFDLNGNVRPVYYKDIAEEMGDWLLGDLYRTQDPALGGWPW